MAWPRHPPPHNRSTMASPMEVVGAAAAAGAAAGAAAAGSRIPLAAGSATDPYPDEPRTDAVHSRVQDKVDGVLAQAERDGATAKEAIEQVSDALKGMEKSPNLSPEEVAAIDDILNDLPGVADHTTLQAASSLASLDHLLSQPSVHAPEQLYALCLVASQVAYWIDSGKEGVKINNEGGDRDTLDARCLCAAIDELEKLTRSVQDAREPAVRGLEVVGLVCSRPSEVRPLGMAPIVVLRHKDTRRLFVAVRGTSTPREWLQDFDAPAKLVDAEISGCPPEMAGARVHEGFFGILVGHRERRWEFRAAGDRDEGLKRAKAQMRRAKVLPPDDEVLRRMQMSLAELLDDVDPDNEYETVFTGHSLGAALAVLHALGRAGAEESSRRRKPLAVTFASPRVGDAELNRRIAERVCHVRVFHDCDPVPCLPGPVVPASFVRGSDFSAYIGHGATHHICVSGYSRCSIAQPYQPNYPSNSAFAGLRIAVSAALYHPLKCYASAFSFRFNLLSGDRPAWWPVGTAPDRNLPEA